MPAAEKHTKRKTRRPKHASALSRLGIATDDALKTVRLVRSGFPYRSVANLQKATALPWSAISRFVGIPQRTLTRRQGQGKLQPDESDRVLRASRVYDAAVALFEGDMNQARKWLQTAQPGLGGDTPLDFASTEVGAHEVESLIGRLEHGVLA